MELKKWSEEFYTQPMQMLHESISEVDKDQDNKIGSSMMQIPSLPVQINGKFMHFFHDNYMQKVKGAHYNTVEVCIDQESGDVIYSLLISQPPGKLTSCEVIDLDPVKAELSKVVAKIKGDGEPDDETLAPLFSGIKKLLASTTKVPIDSLKIKTNAYIEKLREIHENIPKKKGKFSLRDFLSYIKLNCDSHREGWMIDYPKQDKLSILSTKLASLLPLMDETIYGAINSFLPKSPLCLVLFEKDMVLPFKIEEMNGTHVLTSLSIDGLDEFLPIIDHKFHAIIRVVKKKYGVNKVFFLSLSRMMDIFINLVDNVISSDYDESSFMFYQVFLELLLLYAKDFKVSWYSSPRPSLSRFLNRLLLRLFGLNADIPRLWHDNGAKKAINLLKNILGNNSALIIGIVPEKNDLGSMKIYNIELKNSIARSIKPLDNSSYNLAFDSKPKASLLASQLHEQFKEEFGQNFQVIVVSNSMIKLVSSLFKQIFFRSFFNIFSLLKLASSLKGGGKLGFYPPVQGIEELLKKNPLKILKILQKNLFLRY
ncbi:MAG: hypothetical protein ACFFCS_09745 [Candidatus Hodarchaeota archaeon]